MALVDVAADWEVVRLGVFVTLDITTYVWTQSFCWERRWRLLFGAEGELGLIVRHCTAPLTKGTPGVSSQPGLSMKRETSTVLTAKYVSSCEGRGRQVVGIVMTVLT